MSKNFELLIENVIYENSFFPSILIGFDLTFKKKIFRILSLKVFDGDVEINLPKKNIRQLLMNLYYQID